MADERNEMALLAQRGDGKALQALVVSFSQDIERAASKLSKGARAMEIEDLQQLGYEVLIEMLKSWDPDKSPFVAYFRMGLMRKLKKRIYEQNGQNVGMPVNVNGALRSYKAKLANGDECSVDAIAKAWGISVDWLLAAIEIDEGLDELVALHVTDDDGVSELADTVKQLDLSTDDVNLILAIREFGIGGVATVMGLSERAVKYRFEGALSRASEALKK